MTVGIKRLCIAFCIEVLVFLQVIGPLKPGELFIEEDFTLLEKFLMSSSTGKIEKKIKNVEVDPDRYSTIC
jgi:hypothetical protein